MNQNASMKGFYMDHNEMRNYVLFQLHKNLDYWYKLFGEFCDETKIFTGTYVKQVKIDGRKYTISWNAFSGWLVA